MEEGGLQQLLFILFTMSRMIGWPGRQLDGKRAGDRWRRGERMEGARGRNRELSCYEGYVPPAEQVSASRPYWCFPNLLLCSLFAEQGVGSSASL